MSGWYIYHGYNFMYNGKSWHESNSKAFEYNVLMLLPFEMNFVSRNFEKKRKKKFSNFPAENVLL